VVIAISFEFHLLARKFQFVEFSLIAELHYWGCMFLTRL